MALSCTALTRRSHHSIAKKDLLIADLKQKLDGSTREEIVLRRKLQDRTNFIRHFGHDVYELGQHIAVGIFVSCFTSQCIIVLCSKLIHISIFYNFCYCIW